jgi:hypothetical protein
MTEDDSWQGPIPGICRLPGCKNGISPSVARVAELVDALDLGSSTQKV